MNKRQVGSDYEQIAADYLCENGYSILKRNYRNPFGEIDIIARKEDTVVFCEIKYRSDDRFGDPFDSVDLRKQRRISKVALAYTSGWDCPKNVFFRFDVIGIYGDGRVEQIENAFPFLSYGR